MRLHKRRIRLRKWAIRCAIAAIVSLFGACLALAIMVRVVPFPEHQLAKQARSPIVTDRTGQPLLTCVGEDDQWRYPVALEDISPWIARATIAVEDERFYTHGGVDLLAVVRATGQNIASGRVVSGASTLTMQICRMLDDRPRTWRAKLVESFRALQLENRHDKPRILEMYLNMAPYGGNIRGVEAASRRYFGKSAADVSLGEAALLAGLPQAPSCLRPDRYLDAALARRETVLRRMVELEMITEAERIVAARSPVLLNHGLPAGGAAHAARMALARRPAGGRTTIDPGIQAEVGRLVAHHGSKLPARSQIAVVVIDIERADIAALLGSVDFAAPVDGQVNGALALRSPGSALKPFVYAAAFEDRRLEPDSIVYDVPICISGWSPSNFDQRYEGDISVAEALRRSRNVPAILVAQGTGLARVVGLIEAAGIALPPNAQSRAGLGVVVGTAEVTLLDLTNGYATLGRGGVRLTPRLFVDEPSNPMTVMDANVCAAINEILSSQHHRPAGMEDLASVDVPRFMWKTGTSARRRDAWAVGHNGRYAVGVWVGRFSGAGRPEFVGARVAEPLLARIFNLPQVRTTRASPPATPWVVRNPLPPPPELADALTITAPENGAVFIAVNGEAIVRPGANRAEGVSWFLNGRLIDGDDIERLVLQTGKYDLRCADQAGGFAGVRFIVRDSSAQPDSRAF